MKSFLLFCHLILCASVAFPCISNVTKSQADYTTLRVLWANGCPVGTRLQFQIYNATSGIDPPFVLMPLASAGQVEFTSFFLNSSNRVYVLNSITVVHDSRVVTLAGPPVVPAPGSPFSRVDPRAIAVKWGPALLSGDAKTRNSMGTAYETQLSTSPLFVTTTVLISTIPADIWGTSYSATFGCLSPATTYYVRVRAINREGIPTAFTSLGSTMTLSAPPPPTEFSWGGDRWGLSLTSGEVSEADVLLYNEEPLSRPLSSYLLPDKIFAANAKLEKKGDPLRRPLPGGLVEIQTSRSCPARLDSDLAQPATLVFNVGDSQGGIEIGAGLVRKRSLSFYRLDLEKEVWNKIPSQVENGQVTATVKELGTLAVMGQEDVSLQDLRVSPNPFRQSVDTQVTFANLAERATIRLFTPSGREIRRVEETDGDGISVWDGRNSDGDLVEPGVYVFHVESPGAQKRGKVMVLR